MAEITGAAAPRPSVLSLAVKEKSALYAAYMPFLANGGIFVPTSRSHALGDEIYLILSLMDDTSKYPIAGKVVWVTPAGAQGSRPAGIGVQFPETPEGEAVRGKIETLLAGQLGADRGTYTM